MSTEPTAPIPEAPVAPQQHPISELLLVRAENISLRMELLQVEANRLHAEREALRLQACREAGLPEDGLVNWGAKTAMARPPAAPPKK